MTSRTALAQWRKLPARVRRDVIARLDDPAIGEHRFDPEYGWVPLDENERAAKLAARVLRDAAAKGGKRR